MPLCQHLPLRSDDLLSYQLVEVSGEMPSEERLVSRDLKDFGERLGGEGRLVNL